MLEPNAFRTEIRNDLRETVARRQAALRGGAAAQSAGAADGVSEDLIRIDLHCHDRNSDVPDETLGRLLHVPETWLPTAKLVRLLKERADGLTITNHNNARSCWQVLERGEDMLPGAEFSCTLPDLQVGVHVLTFGFTPAQETKLNALRKDIYRFLEYTAAEDIPTILAHPLNFYSPRGLPSLDLMDRFALLFERFEGVNGQRDTWQNLLTMAWVESLDEERLEAAGKRTGIKPGAFCRHPYRKSVAGGSDCHMGIFTGSTGTLLPAPGWRRSRERRSDLALSALRAGVMAPYGSHCEEEKLTVAFLDFFCQVALRMEDPGLLRLLLHRGTASQKLLALGIANGMFELRRHRYTSRFLGLFHECLQGRKPGWITSLLTNKAYKPLLGMMEQIAEARARDPGKLVEVLCEAIPGMFGKLNALLADRVTGKLRAMEDKQGRKLEAGDLLGRIELPTHFRALFGYEPRSQGKDAGGLDVGRISDGLPFPLLASLVLGGAAFAASKVLYGKRPFLESFADRLGKYRHPRRALWLTDTLADKNGVSHVLQAMLAEARRRDLPIDFLACGREGDQGQGAVFRRLRSEGNLRLLPPVAEFTLPMYRDQVIRLPGLLELQKVFLEGGYDRIICSTEAPMGLLALYLKHAFNVPAFFYTHSDWLDFARRTMRFDTRKVDRLRRILRAFYRRFDGVFLLNTEQKESFASPSMGLAPDKLFLTAHWANPDFHRRAAKKSEVFPGVGENDPVILYAGRLSEEKGVMELPQIFRGIRASVPGARLALAGTGPCEDGLRSALPEALFLGWLDANRLAEAYSAADVLLLPSWFDTFSCSLLEALSCGLPAVAYNTKGPRDILSGGQGGLLAGGPEEMAEMAASILKSPSRIRSLRARARRRAADYRAEAVMDGLIADLGLGHGATSRSWTAAEAVQDMAGAPEGEEDPALIGDLLALMGSGKA